MPNHYLKMILIPMKERTIGQLLALIRFYKRCTPQELQFAMKVDYHLNIK